MTKMKKGQITWLLICLILLALFNILFFTLGGNQPLASIWLSYGFIHLSIVLLIVAPLLIPKSKNSNVFFQTTGLLTASHFLIQLTIGILLILFKLELWTLVLSIHLVVLAAFSVIYLLNNFANKHTASQEARKKDIQETFKASIAEISNAIIYASESDKNYLNSLMLDIKSSPLVVNDSLQGIENNILSECTLIRSAAEQNDSNGIHSHGSTVSQLVLLRKQNPS